MALISSIPSPVFSEKNKSAGQQKKKDVFIELYICVCVSGAYNKKVNDLVQNRNKHQE